MGLISAPSWRTLDVPSDEPNQKHVRDWSFIVPEPLAYTVHPRRVLMTTSTRTYVDPPDSLRAADQALVRLRASLQALGTAYLLGDVRAIQAGLSVAIGHSEQITTYLKKTHDRSTRT